MKRYILPLALLSQVTYAVTSPSDEILFQNNTQPTSSINTASSLSKNQAIESGSKLGALGSSPTSQPKSIDTVVSTTKNPKKSSRRKHYKKQPTTIAPIASKTFDFQYIGPVIGALWALKEYEPRLEVLEPLGNKQQINVSIDLSNITIQDVIDTINNQSNNRAKVVFDPVANTIRLYFDSKVDYGVDAVEESKKWREGGDVRPVKGKDGIVLFPYGEQQAQIICQPLQLCDISFEAGEYMTSNPIIGDEVRWTVYDAVSQENGKTVQHLTMKPHQAGLDTSLMVPTNKRTYMIRLRSSDYGYVSRSAFFYPKEFNINPKLQNQAAADVKSVNGTTVNNSDAIKLNATTGISNLDFNYQIKGKDYKWKPLRVFSDGVHTYIQMPSGFKQDDSPTFNILGPGDTPEIVNWDLINNVYVIDKIFSKGEMVIGNSDSTIERIEIIHTEKN